MAQAKKATGRAQKTAAQAKKAESRVKKIAGPVKKAAGPVKTTAEQVKTDAGRAVRGTGNFKCDYCETMIVRKFDLGRHMNEKHRGLRFPCTRCDATFGQPYNREIHEQTKHDGIQYFCVSPHAENPTVLCGFICDQPSKMTPHRKKFHKEALNTKNALLYPNKVVKHDSPFLLPLPEWLRGDYSLSTDVQAPAPGSPASSEPSTAPSSPSISTPLTLSGDLSSTSPRLDASKDLMMEPFSSATLEPSPRNALSYPSSPKSFPPAQTSVVSTGDVSWSRFESLVSAAANMPRLPEIGTGGMS